MFATLASVFLVAVHTMLPVPLWVGLSTVWGIVMWVACTHAAVNRKWGAVTGVLLWLCALAVLIVGVVLMILGLGHAIWWFTR
jgi:hypothetical protein